MPELEGDGGGVSPRLLTTRTVIRPRLSMLDLAPELRHKIFECCFERHRVTVQCGDYDCDTGHCHYRGYAGQGDDDNLDTDCPDTLAVTKVSRLIRHESMSAFLRTAIFDFQLLDYHPGWKPSPQLRACIKRMRYMFGPPRLMHYLGITTLPWCSTLGDEDRWVTEYTTAHIVCDMIVDQFDLQDAMASKESNEGRYFEGIKNAIASPKGHKLTICVQVEDGEPSYESWDGLHARTGFQVWKRQVIVRQSPRTEQGKDKLKGCLTLMGLELQQRDRHIINPAQKQDGLVDEGVGNMDVDNAVVSADATAAISPSYGGPMVHSTAHTGTGDMSVLTEHQGIDNTVIHDADDERTLSMDGTTFTASDDIGSDIDLDAAYEWWSAIHR